MKAVLFLALFLLPNLVLAADGVVGFQPKIIGGVEVSEGHPLAQSTVLIIGKIARASFTCTGVVLAEDMILTAGHCLGGPGYASLEIYFRTRKNGKGPVIKGVRQMRMAAPKLGVELDWDDVAVVKLASKIPDNYKPVEIIPAAQMIQNQTEVILAGYGITVPQMPKNGDGGAGVLRLVQQVVINPNYGQKEFLVSIEKKGSCSGDSGGPAYIEEQGRLYLAGIASRMTKNNIVSGSGSKAEYACIVDLVYSNVLSQMNWIQDAIKELRK